MNKWILSAVVLAAAFGVTSVAWSADEAPTVTKAVAKIQPAQEGGASGTVTFTQVNGGVAIVADFKGLKPGKHGFHIHEKGECVLPNFESAGGHFNPLKKDHGGPDAEKRHVGDLGNLKALEDGTAHYERVDSVIELNGTSSIIGHAVILHTDADDYTTQPTGNAGGRVACGIVEAVTE